MARTRLINPAAPMDEDVARLSMAARLLWAYLPCHADKAGRLKDSPFTLRAVVFPGDTVDVDALLGELAAARHVIRYEVDGRRFMQIRNFAKYQSPHKREAESDIPEPPISVQAEACQEKPGPSVASRAYPVSDPVTDPVAGIPPSAPARDPSSVEDQAPAPAPTSTASTLTGSALAETFGRIRNEVTGKGFPWSGNPANPEKAANMAEGIVREGRQRDVEPAIRMFWESVRDGRHPKAADCATKTSLAFGCFCADWPDLVEAIHGVTPAAPPAVKARANGPPIRGQPSTATREAFAEILTRSGEMPP